MSVTPSQLSEIHKELIAHFISHPTISVNPTQGDPPEEYDISYQIGGMSQTEDGEIQETFGHSINLTIPFGFPHFPPSCKPNGKIFHPDFDPAAICIGNFWEHDHSLPNLIINIGRMINCEIYSTSNFFNEDAGDWYQKNGDRLPLSEITWTAVFEAKAQSDDDLIDTLDDSDLSTDFNFHEIELSDDPKNEDISISDAFPQVESVPDSAVKASDIPTDGKYFREISLLNNQKKYFKLQQVIKRTTHTSDELLLLLEKSAKVIERAENLYAEAKIFEDQGKAQQALRLLEQIDTSVTDFPAIKSDIKRVEQTIALLQDVSPELLDSPQMELESFQPEIEGPSPQSTSTKQNKKSLKTSAPQTETTFFEETKETAKSTILTILLILILLAAGVSYFWFSASKNLDITRQAAEKCNSLLQNNEFTKSKNVCEQGLISLNKVKFLQQSEVQTLRNLLNKILQSEQLNQGIAGNVLFNGKYLSKEAADQHRLLNAALETATTAYTDEQWKKALESYIQVQQFLTNSDLSTSLPKQELINKIALCKFRISFDKAIEFMKQKKWASAINQFQSSRPLIVHLSPEDKTHYEELLQTNLSMSKFDSLKEKGDIAFAKSSWQEASSFYSDALTHLNQKNQILPEALSIIENNNKRAQLYKTITEGNQAFSSADWNKAIAAYDRADEYLIRNQGLLSLSDSQLSRKKIAQIRLQASIIRDKQVAESQLTENNLNAGKKTYQNIILNIDAHAYGQEEMFAQSRKELLQKIETLSKEIYQEEKKAYLIENFQTLFIANYPASDKENLTNPLVTFSKEVNNKSVFRMQCSETGRGRRPLTLVMFYAFDKNTSRWSLYSDQ